MIDAIVVESHNDALVHIHKALRKQKRLGQPWRMLHFDSHADLACPGPHVPAYCCFRPSYEVKVNAGTNNINSCDCDSDVNTADVEALDLYELLNTTASGIAEWILPLVLAADLVHVHWTRPKHDVYLIPTGSHCYRVGAWWKSTVGDTTAAGTMATSADGIHDFTDLPMAAVVKVDSPLLYYLEDESTVPSHELALAQNVNLQVSESPDEVITMSDETQSLPYILDICLDYFCCVNPFIVDLERVSAPFAKAFQRAIAATKFAQSASDQEKSLYSGPEALEQSFAFQKSLKFVLEITVRDVVHSPDVLARMFEAFFKAREEGAELIGSLVNALLDYENAQLLSDMAIEAIPYAMMPHDGSLFDHGDETNSLLEYPWIEKRLQTFRTIIERQKEPPFLVTIARSSNDGFTPTNVVEQIQHGVLSVLDAAYSILVIPDSQVLVLAQSRG